MSSPSGTSASSPRRFFPRASSLPRMPARRSSRTDRSGCATGASSGATTLSPSATSPNSLRSLFFPSGERKPRRSPTRKAGVLRSRRETRRARRFFRTIRSGCVTDESSGGTTRRSSETFRSWRNFSYRRKPTVPSPAHRRRRRWSSSALRCSRTGRSRCPTVGSSGETIRSPSAISAS